MRIGSLGQVLLKLSGLSPEELLEKPQKSSVWERLTFYAVPMSERQAEAAERAKRAVLRKQLAWDRKAYYELTANYYSDERINRWKQIRDRQRRLASYIRRRIARVEARIRGLEDAFNRANPRRAFYIGRKIGYLQNRLEVWKKLLLRAESRLQKAEEKIGHLYEQRKKAAQLQRSLAELDPMEWALPEVPGLKEAPKSLIRTSHDDLSEYTDANGFRQHYLAYL